MSRAILALMAALALVPTAAQAQSAGSNRVCLPPVEPYVPSSDDEFRAYADMVSDDFNRYFREITDYFICMDETRQAVFERARDVSKAHQAFWQRSDELGVTERAATNRPDAVSHP
ncbi:hypothetical protein [uncultured Paracoccus sp.]|uniref:hypothetical protein n=1 Tax=uncultured Paracoccus sp. TaxID=189685 RepID=UPI0026059236|nr:hypothetical protein [uncultured Paracoccus sp.]